MADSTEPSKEDKSEMLKAKRRERDRLYYQKNKAKIAEYWRSTHARELRKAYRERHKEKRNAKNREYMRADREKNPEKYRERVLAYQRKHPEAHRRRSARYYERHKSCAAAANRRYEKRMFSESPSFAMAKRLRSRLRKAMDAGSARKAKSTFVLVGCSPDELKNHIESQFLDGMTWENSGKWHIDHIIPLARFDLQDEEQQRAAFHYTNLRPLWAADNIKKGKKVPGQHLFGFAYAAKIADGVSSKSKRGRSKHASGQHGDD